MMPSTLRPKQKLQEEKPSSQQLQQVELAQQNSLPSTLKRKMPEKEVDSEISENIKEIPYQFLSGTAEGLLGSYGDILDILGLQSKTTRPGEKAKMEREFPSLQKLERGEKPSFSELEELSDEDVLPRYSRLPTSGDIRDTLGLEQPKTMSGRYARRGGQFAGGTASFGQTGLSSSLIPAAAGQTAEELGAPPWVQAAAEIGTSLKLSKAKSPISSSDKEIKNELNRLKGMGFSDQDLTLARNALEDRGFLKKSAKYTNEARNKFKQTYKNVDKNINSIIENSFPGLSKEGPQAFKDAAISLYDSLDSVAREVKVNHPEDFIKSTNKAISKLQETLAESPQKKQVISFLEEAQQSAKPKPIPSTPEKVVKTGILDQYGKPVEKVIPGTPEIPRELPRANHYTNFYKDLNAVGNWGNPKEREHVFRIIKDAIKDTLKKQGPEGAKVAYTLEEANDAWMKYLKAEDVYNLMEKASTEKGINFKKLHQILQKPDKLDVLKTGLGDRQANNILKLSEITSQIKDFEKTVKGGVAKSLLSEGILYGLSSAILTGDIRSLKTIAGMQIAGRLSTNLLTNPSYQNIALRMANAAKDKQWNVVLSLSKALKHKVYKDQDLINK